MSASARKSHGQSVSECFVLCTSLFSFSLPHWPLRELNFMEMNVEVALLISVVIWLFKAFDLIEVSIEFTGS